MSSSTASGSDGGSTPIPKSPLSLEVSPPGQTPVPIGPRSMLPVSVDVGGPGKNVEFGGEFAARAGVHPSTVDVGGFAGASSAGAWNADGRKADCLSGGRATGARSRMVDPSSGAAMLGGPWPYCPNAIAGAMATAMPAKYPSARSTLDFPVRRISPSVAMRVVTWISKSVERRANTNVLMCQNARTQPQTLRRTAQAMAVRSRWDSVGTLSERSG